MPNLQHLVYDVLHGGATVCGVEHTSSVIVGHPGSRCHYRRTMLTRIYKHGTEREGKASSSLLVAATVRSVATINC